MSTAQTIPFGRASNLFARQKAWDQIQKTGRALPCSVVSADGAIITVKFEILSNFTLPQIAVPLFGPQYIRYPIQPNDLGIVLPADAQIGAMCGLGTGTADLAQPFNLGALVFLPIGNKMWSAVDPQSVTIYGPNGVVLYDTGKNSSITLTPDGIACIGKNSFMAQVGDAMVSLTTSQAVIGFGDNSVTITSSGTVFAGPVTFSGLVDFASGPTIVGTPFDTHQHSGVTGGTGNTGGVVP